MDIRSDAWLGDILGMPAFRVVAEGDARVVARHGAEQPSAFYFAKVEAGDTATVAALSRVGFSVVDTNVTFGLRDDAPHVEPAVEVGELVAGEEEAVLDIAGSAFRYSRFHLDPQVPDDIAHRIKREWCHNYIRGARGDHLFVARKGGKPLGFLAALIAGDIAVIDLVGVATDAQRQGVGRALTAAFIDHYRGRPMHVGTQVANVPSVRLYEQMGFSLVRSQYVLHWHVRGQEST